MSTKVALSYVNLFCTDIEAMFGFYQGLFDLEEIVESRSPMFRGARTGAASIGFSAHDAYALLGLEQATDALGDQALLTFEVPDRAAVDALTAKALLQGATQVKAPFETYYGWYQSVLRDPEGHAFRINRAG
ncbi:VOC family protein [Caulobacter hibisci]|uniref:VOC family protein n=1 Tax=Caulobacter hibisci TaxID=2035993 RepID=A0ABS0SZT4_9CAUL|nr:VOC family protein [Caulobacter hibisci]MBI1685142.1 VOC family protein [Caulobacter hibisci]